MRGLSVAVLLSLILFGSAAQNSPLKPDGRMWGTWDFAVKAAYVQGALEGLRAGGVRGYFAGRVDEANAELDYLRPCQETGPCAGIPLAKLVDTGFNDKDVSAGADRIRGGFTPQKASVQDIAHQIDKFYADSRNTSVCMVAAVQESMSSLDGTVSKVDLEMARLGCNP